MVAGYRAVSQVGCGRGVLEGAFEILDTLGQADGGLGLTELAHRAGLAKSTAHRLAEQLVAVGAVQCVERRYYVGPTIARLGRLWQPDPRLQQAADGPVCELASRAGTAAAVYLLHERRAHLITAAVGRGQSWFPPPDVDVALIPHSAVGRVLLAADGSHDAARLAQWRRWQPGLRDWGTVIADDHAAANGIRWVAAPIWRPDQRCAAAVAALVPAPSLPPGLKDLVVRTARRIADNFRAGNPHGAQPTPVGRALAAGGR